ncbi:MAG: helix-turn-helix transcriptional regulator [Deltaproteobacteria bacterium]|nr:helix-turn-helix transcriptional regulator [Deltaproteobacteria bacterium]
MAGKEPLSEKEIVILGLISEGPIHAYSLEEKIRERRLTEWTDISFSSIYRVLKTLEDKELITTRFEHEGQGATRKIHEINEKGLSALSVSIVDLLSEMKPLRNPFLVALANLSKTSMNQRVLGLKRRLKSIEAVEESISGLKRIHGLDERTGILEQGKDLLGVSMIYEFAKRHIQAEKDFVSYVLDLFQDRKDEKKDAKRETRAGKKDSRGRTKTGK